MTTWIDLAGWTLVHFVWQGALIAALAAVGLRLLRARTALARYALACAALGMMLAAPPITAWLLATGTSIAPAATGPERGAVSAPTATPVSSPAPARAPAGPPSTAITLPLGGVSLALATWLPTIVALWLAGVALLLMRLAGGCWRVRRLRQAALAEAASRWQLAADAIARRLALGRPVFIVDSARVDTPTAIGWLRPVILLPLAAMSSLTPAQVDAILAHELAHIRRHDFLVNLLQTIAETILFYHPAVWWISSRIRTEREHCCDDVAVGVCGDPVEYASALTELAAWSVGRAPLAMAATGGSLLDRVRRVLRVQDDAPRRATGGILIAGLALGLAVVAGSLTAVSLAQTTADDRRGAADGRIGPREVNELLGFNLFPGPTGYPTDDPRDARSWGLTIRHPNGELPFIGFTARSLIREAYGLGTMPIVDGPRWLDEDSFDITVDRDVSVVNGAFDRRETSAAIRSLLEGQLGLAAHRARREFPVYALVRRSADSPLGPGLRPSTAVCFDGRPGRAPVPGQGPGQGLAVCGFDDSLTGKTGLRVTMTDFANEMSRARVDLLSADRIVVDRTGLNGSFDLQIRFGLVPLAAMATAAPAARAALWPFGIRTLHSALPEQLGLALEESTAEFEVFVIDRINRPAAP